MTNISASTTLAQLVARSRKLGADRSIANWGGGNTSAKAEEVDFRGRRARILWVKGSGSDLATVTEASFTGLYLDDVLPLLERERMSDTEMVDYLAHCFYEPGRPRPSIETLLHGFLPFDHVDHTHADATNYFACAEDGEKLARDCFGDDLIWIPYRRPGFGLAREVALAVRANSHARLVILAKHGLITWGETDEEWPRIVITRRVANDGGRYFGPITTGGSPQRTLDLLERLFRFRKCTMTIKGDQRPCLYYHLHRCLAPCASKTTIAAYEAELARAGVAGRIETALADAQFWNEQHMDEVIADKHIQVLVPPDGSGSGKQRAGWTGGRYTMMRHVLASPLGQQLYRKRMQTIEPVFGHTRHNRGVTRFLRRGRTAVRTEWRLLMMTHNLTKLHSHQIATSRA